MNLTKKCLKKYISPEEIEKIIDDLRLISLYNNGTSKKW